jgi:hypothetical protein
MRECPHCGTEVPPESRYCRECGRPLGPDGTAVFDTPILVRRWPPDPFVLIGALLALGALVLLVGGEWAWGVAAVLGGLVVFVARDDLNRRRATWAFGDLRLRAAATRDAVAARSREQLDVFRARRELAELEAERDRLLRDLGAAVYADDDAGERAVRAALDSLVERLVAKEAEIETLRAEAEQRVARAQANVRPTETLDDS